MIEYLGKLETDFENTLACLSGAQMGSNHKNNGVRKSRDPLPLKTKKRRQFAESLHSFRTDLSKEHKYCNFLSILKQIACSSKLTSSNQVMQITV